jgi:hypothetical protein
MGRAAPLAILFTAMLLALTAIATVALDQGSHNSLKAAEFQRLVGGLGFGPATNLSDCPATFDPRISGVCPFQYEPIPAGQNFLCPRHSYSILPFSKFPPN